MTLTNQPRLMNSPSQMNKRYKWVNVPGKCLCYNQCLYYFTPETTYRYLLDLQPAIQQCLLTQQSNINESVLTYYNLSLSLSQTDCSLMEDIWLLATSKSQIESESIQKCLAEWLKWWPQMYTLHTNSRDFQIKLGPAAVALFHSPERKKASAFTIGMY